MNGIKTPTSNIPDENFIQSTSRKLLRRYHNLRGQLDIRYTYRKQLVNAEAFGEQVARSIDYLKNIKGPEEINHYLEFGVCHGTSMISTNSELVKSDLNHVQLTGFDSFEGLPEDDEGRWRKGAFNSDIDYTKHLMTESSIDWSRTNLVQGWFSETLNDETIERYNLSKVSIVNIDCDIYSASKEALNFCIPLFDDVTILIFDDWNPLALENKGEKRAFDEFLAENSQFEAEPFGEYSYNPGDLHGKLFVLRRV